MIVISVEKDKSSFEGDCRKEAATMIRRTPTRIELRIEDISE